MDGHNGRMVLNEKRLVGLERDLVPIKVVHVDCGHGKLRGILGLDSRRLDDHGKVLEHHV